MDCSGGMPSTTGTRASTSPPSTSGTRLDRDRPTRQAAWPGEDPAPTIQDFTFTDRDTEFVEFVIAQVRKRQEAEDEFYASLDDDDDGS